MRGRSDAKLLQAISVSALCALFAGCADAESRQNVSELTSEILANSHSYELLRTCFSVTERIPRVSSYIPHGLTDLRVSEISVSMFFAAEANAAATGINKADQQYDFKAYTESLLSSEEGRRQVAGVIKECNQAYIAARKSAEISAAAGGE